MSNSGKTIIVFCCAEPDHYYMEKKKMDKGNTDTHEDSAGINSCLGILQQFDCYVQIMNLEYYRLHIIHYMLPSLKYEHYTGSNSFTWQSSILDTPSYSVDPTRFHYIAS